MAQPMESCIWTVPRDDQTFPIKAKHGGMEIRRSGSITLASEITQLIFLALAEL